MSLLASRSRFGNIVGLAVVGILGSPAIGLGGAPPAAAPQPSLATAAEMLSQRKLAEACEVVCKLGLDAPDVTDSDRVRLYLVVAMQRADVADEVGAQKAILEALKLDREARMPSFASNNARTLLDDVRARTPPPPPLPKPAKQSQPPGFVLFSGEDHPREAPARATRPAERPAVALSRAVDALYGSMQLEAADLMLDLAERAQPLPKDEQARVTLRRGILLMESGEEEKAASAFQQAQELNPQIKMPEYAPPKTLRVFLDAHAKFAAPSDVGAKAPAAPTPASEPEAHSAAKPERPGLELGPTLLGVGGVTLSFGALTFLASAIQRGLVWGEVMGGVIAGVSVAAMVGGLVIINRPELLALRVTVAPIDRGGVLVAAGHF